VEKGKITEAEARRAEEEERSAQGPEEEWFSYVRSRLDAEEISKEEAQAVLDVRTREADPPPDRIKGVPRFGRDLVAISEMVVDDSPPEVNVRSLGIFEILYGLADASEKGFGSHVLGKDGTRYRIGIWDKDTEEETSNFREFENVVGALEEEAAKGNLKGAEVYMCTDNSTVELALYRGTSSSEKLFALVVRLRKLEMREGARIMVTHIESFEWAAGKPLGHIRVDARDPRVCLFIYSILCTIRMYLFPCQRGGEHAISDRGVLCWSPVSGLKSLFIWFM
jgi:hypothetical protein